MSLYKQAQGKIYWFSIYDGHGGRIRGSTGTTDKIKAEPIVAVVMLGATKKNTAQRLHTLIDSLLPATAEDAVGLSLEQVWPVYTELFHVVH